MSDLRDEIADIVTDATDERHDRTVRGDYDPTNEEPYVTRILASVADALTSEPTLCEVEYAVSSQHLNALRYSPSYLTPYQKGVVAVNAALRAAGITKGEGDE